jgi:hypothetical protein
VLLKVVFDDEGNMKVTRSNIIKLPIKYFDPPKTLRNQLGLLLEQATWSMSEMAGLL